MIDFLSYFKLILTILRKCILATVFQNGQTVLLPLFLREHVSEHTRSVQPNRSMLTP